MDTKVLAESSSIKEVVRVFATAVKEKDFYTISTLLADVGEFQIQDERQEAQDCADKATFIAWLKIALSEAVVTKVEYDQCMLCKIGNPVVLFNDGKFPQVKKELSWVSMQGMMLSIEDGRITGLNFCYTFLYRQNPYQHECPQQKKEIYELVAKGVPMRQACEIVLIKHGYMKDEN